MSLTQNLWDFAPNLLGLKPIKVAEGSEEKRSYERIFPKFARIRDLWAFEND